MAFLAADSFGGSNFVEGIIWIYVNVNIPIGFFFGNALTADHHLKNNCVYFTNTKIQIK